MGSDAHGFRSQPPGLFPICHASVWSRAGAVSSRLNALNDVVHTIASLYFGKRRIVPTSNPNLTWEGFACAFIVTTASSYLIYPYLTPLSPTFGLLSGMLISLAGFFGDLTVSVLKRDLLIGDDGRFDALKKSYLSRVDSLTYTSPIFFHFIRYFYDFM